jgi:hypothetical protein
MGKILLIIFIIRIVIIPCFGTRNNYLSNSKEEILQEFKKNPNKVFVTAKDTISLFYKTSHNVVTIKCLKNKEELFIKKITIDDLISDAPFKDKAYFEGVYFTAFEEKTKEIVFTSYIKRTDIKNYRLEADFTLNLNGIFNAIRD